MELFWFNENGNYFRKIHLANSTKILGTNPKQSLSTPLFSRPKTTLGDDRRQWAICDCWNDINTHVWTLAERNKVDNGRLDESIKESTQTFRYYASAHRQRQTGKNRIINYRNAPKPQPRRQNDIWNSWEIHITFGIIELDLVRPRHSPSTHPVDSTQTIYGRALFIMGI